MTSQQESPCRLQRMVSMDRYYSSHHHHHQHHHQYSGCRPNRRSHVTLPLPPSARRNSAKSGNNCGGGHHQHDQHGQHDQQHQQHQQRQRLHLETTHVYRLLRQKSAHSAKTMSELLAYLQSTDDNFKSKSRLASLYSDFSHLKTSNPEGYAANVSAWRSALTEASRAGKTPGNGVFTIQTGPALERALERKPVGRPLSIGSVVSESVHARQMVALREFLESKSSVYAKRWAPRLEDMALWAMSWLGWEAERRDLTGYDFVLLGMVEEASKSVIEKVCTQGATHSSLIYTMETFRKEFEDVLRLDDSAAGAEDDTSEKEKREDATSKTTTTSRRRKRRVLNTSDISILLVHLYRDKKAIDMKLDAKSGSTIIKFGTSPPTLPEPISENDSTVAVLHTLSQSLGAQADALRARVDSLQRAATEALARGQRERALQSLKLKRLAATTLRKREDSMLQVASVLDSIDEALANRETVNALERSSAVLHEINGQIGGAERVERVLEGLAEGMADVEEVSGVLGALGADRVDEGELESELEALEQEVGAGSTAGEKQQQQEKPIEMPDVPPAAVGKEQETGKKEDKKDDDRESEVTRELLGRMSLEEGGAASKG